MCSRQASLAQLSQTGAEYLSGHRRPSPSVRLGFRVYHFPELDRFDSVLRLSARPLGSLNCYTPLDYLGVRAENCATEQLACPPVRRD